MRPLILAAFCAILPIAASAQTFRSESKLTVVPVTATSFEVIEDRAAGPRGYWCAAADFARSRLGAYAGARIYIKSGRGPSLNASGRKGVVFTTDASSLSVSPSNSYVVSLTTVGYNLRSSHAYSFCSDFKLRRSFR